MGWLYVRVVRDTPVPYPYIAVLNLTTFVFVYATPFLYVNTGMFGEAKDQRGTAVWDKIDL